MSIITDGLKRLDAAGIRSFKAETAQTFEREFTNYSLDTAQFDRIIGEIIAEENPPRNLVGYIKKRLKDLRTATRAENPNHWWIIGGHCLRCNNTGFVPELAWAKVKNGDAIMLDGKKMLVRKLLHCDCVSAKPIIERDDVTRSWRVFPVDQYNEAYDRDGFMGFQFPFCLMREKSGGNYIDYPYFFQHYEYSFIRRYAENKDALFFENEIEIPNVDIVGPN